MMVTFVSQCEKKALNRTRRVLDSFANRIGDNTWQTVITQEGLNAVKKLLRKTATKNTAVSCHWIRSRSRSQFLWVVGSKEKFNEQGIVPVNSTQKNIMNHQWETNWIYLPLIKAITALAALFHDWGKASVCFQEKLKSKKPLGDPLRHEWVSCILLRAIVGDAIDDVSWLRKLSEGEINEASILEQITSKPNKRPLAKLPPLASIISWLIMTHHKLPIPNEKEEIKKFREQPLEDPEKLFNIFQQNYGYENLQSKIDTGDCFTFLQGLPSRSPFWVKQIKKWSHKTLDTLPLMQQAFENGVWRLLLHHARLSLMLGDYSYSSQKADEKWRSEIELFANSDRNTKQLKQKLDEHLVGVTRCALRTCHLLPSFESDLPKAEGLKRLQQKSPSAFSWQDKAVKSIKEWRKKELKGEDTAQYAFFAVNMASTGCGKTFANAKIMQALSEDFSSLRYTLALGLRTLTLQTGDEYRKRIELDNTELAVLIGSRAVLDLHDMHENADETSAGEECGSESSSSLLDEEIDYDCDVPYEGIATLFQQSRDKKFLYSPVLVCTIDHLMSATETKRGGRHILPGFRLMSSDLVIDEIDDFDGDDLVAIGRLIHLAGMLGRKVMISSATIPPDLARGYFNAYQQGWMLFAKSRGLKKEIGCAWIDEFASQAQTIAISAKESDEGSFNAWHREFVEKRTKALQSQMIKRKGTIVEIPSLDKTDEESLRGNYFNTIAKEILVQHSRHYATDPVSRKNISFGVVRVANIEPCVSLGKYLLNYDYPENTAVKVMVYHSRQVLLMRNEQERHLDEVLKRSKDSLVYQHPVIRKHIQTTPSENIIFILVATPVEEIGRDHDFDWAIVEPSSYRSIIQLAGRVLRHRERSVSDPNISLLQYNLKGCLEQNSAANSKRKPVFTKPGYETAELLFKTHNLKVLLPEEIIEAGINAIPRVNRQERLQVETNLIDLEHYSIANLLVNFDMKGPEAMEGWLSQCWWLTALPQTLRVFRKGNQMLRLYLLPMDPEADEMVFAFMEKDDQGKLSKAEECQGIQHEPFQGDRDRLWLERDYQRLLTGVVEKFNMDIRKAALRFGEIALEQYEGSLNTFTYSPEFGLVRQK